jgi:selenocysteine lyase/cysteine desulfurase
VQAISFPVSGTEDILAQVEASFPTDGSVSFAVFDHVTSNTGILLPIKKLIELAHARGAKVLVDGAHGLQSQNLDLRDLGADWYTSNCHKWLCGVKGTGFLYVSPEVRSETRALVISHGYGEGFNSEFIWDGTRDYSGLVAISSLLKWWEILGHDNAREYCESLLVRAVDVLKTTWGTGTHAPMSCYSHMACVEIPSSALPPSAFTTDPTDGTKKINATSEHSKMIQDALHFDGKIECPVKTLGSKCYFRISAGIYNSIQDYERLAEFVLQLTWPEEK